MTAMGATRPAILAVSPGDPAGIGPELALMALARTDPAEAMLRVRAGRKLLERVSRASGIPFPGVLCISPGEEPPERCGGHVLVDDQFEGECEPGRVSACCGAYAARQVRTAAQDVLAGRADALVTMPLCKESARLGGCPFPGHTELLASVCGAKSPPVMAFHSGAVAAGGRCGGLALALATIHEPLARVPSLLDAGGILHVLRTVHSSFGAMCGGSPRIGVLGLNPHAGENGLIGREEIETIRPAVARAREEGIDAHGPLVPDAAFSFLAAAIRDPSAAPPFDAYVAMYHDQGLIPFKLAAFGSAVNVTLGLPIVRTSPGHGTAFDIAWRGKAGFGATGAAIRLAAKMAALRRQSISMQSP